MRRFNAPESACERVAPALDSYLSLELDDARAGEVRGHVESCAACSREIKERERLRALVRRAVRRESAPERLRLGVRQMLRGEAR
ncbi:MAG TPA: zf-HC2 domain-containing protein [Pyrinomonadaceae bacterium]|nr:zf-HC2 domain-containing protein [Pyrinomonadaceae bacterium]